MHASVRGPNWIHGTNNNPILELANETDTTHVSPSMDADPWVYDESGEMVEAAAAAEQIKNVWDTVEEATTYSKDNFASIPADKSLIDFFQTKIVESNLSPAESKHFLQIAGVWGDIVGEPIEGQSLKYFWLEECVGGGLCLTFQGKGETLFEIANLRYQKTCFLTVPTKPSSNTWRNPPLSMSTSN